MSQPTSKLVAQFDWQQQFYEHVCSILNQHIGTFAPAAAAYDQKRNTDFMVIKPRDDLSVACRIRTADMAKGYLGEFTIRTRSAYGKETELHKLIKGYGHYLFYGFAAQDQPGKVVKWFIGDLSEFRYWLYYRTLVDGKAPGKEFNNRDGTAFRAFRLEDMPVSFLVAQDGLDSHIPSQSALALVS